MADGNGGTTPSNPPSFIPSGARRRADGRADAPQAATPASSPAAPPTFAPPSRARRTPSAAPAAPAAQPSGQAAPVSFTPAARSTRRSADRQRAAGARSSSPQPRSSADGEQPRSFAPAAAAQPRRSSGSSRNATPAPASRPPSGGGRAGYDGAGGRPVQPLTAGAVARPRRRHRPLRILLATLALLVVALVLCVFGAWNWVDGNLSKSDWLTDMANTKGTSWLLLGSDERDGTEGVAGSDASDITGFRTDTILVLTKPASGPSSLISIPRDSLMEVEGQYLKINAVAQIYGDKALVGQVEELTGQKIDHVAEIRFGGLKNVVDALGGVELCYGQDVSDGYSGLEWQAGCHTADGTTALAFSRMRYADVQGDFGRAARQRQVIGAIMSKALSSQTLLDFGKVRTLADAALSSITVDDTTNPYTLLQMALAFRSATADGGISGSVYWSDPDYYVDGVGSSVLLDDAKNKELFSQLGAGTHDAGEVGTLAEG